MKEQRMNVLSQQQHNNNVGRRNGSGQPRHMFSSKCIEDLERDPHEVVALFVDSL
ncbi:hypothetical protein HanPSC8_Chr16g0707531 [Helianthus annuus]|nr:hypothetical protein HanPSC8_Chr16g0707531 [Helianthus annuus]